MNQKLIWIGTSIVAVAMIVGAVVFVRQQQSASVPVEQVVATPAPETLIPVEPAEPVASVTPQAEPAPEPSKPVVYDEVRVDLSKIAGTLKMSSPDIPAVASGLPRYPLDLTCYRKNSSPAVNWSSAPAGTKSYVLVLERRAPNEKASWPWIMFNIPSTTTALPGKISPETITTEQGVFGKNPYGHNAYTGPCDPRGIFPYVLRLFALDKEVPLQAGATLPELLPAMNGHVIDSAEIRVEHYLRQ